MNDGAGVYAFWELIAQEAHLPDSEMLRENTWSRFCELAGKKRIWMFGCNDACREWIGMYGGKWDICGILDNSPVRWHKEYCGKTVYPPGQVLPDMGEDDAVIIALRLNTDLVAKQLADQGIADIYSLGVLVSGIEPYRSFAEACERMKQAPLRGDVVLIESINDFDGNSGALYEWMKLNNCDSHFIWLCKSEESQSPYMDDRDSRLCPAKGIDDLKEYIRVRSTAKWEIWECDPIRKVRKDQINVFLQHYGMGYKQVAHLYRSPHYVDYALTTNAFVHQMEKKSITYGPDTKFIYGELPRNDVLHKRDWDELSALTCKTYQKVVMWAPTLRESRYSYRMDSDIEYPFGISLLYTDVQMERLNEFLETSDILMIIKIHPQQRLNFTEKEYSNILYLDGDRAKRLHPYKLLTQVDAMITDYSSIVFDYMLLDRPIAWVLEDREHYKIEYLMDNPEEYMPGAKIYTLEDLFLFLADVGKGVDPYQRERREICARCNPPFEGRGCERLVQALGL